MMQRIQLNSLKVFFAAVATAIGFMSSVAAQSPPSAAVPTVSSSLGKAPVRPSSADQPSTQTLLPALSTNGLTLETSVRRASRNFYNAVYSASNGVNSDWMGNVGNDVAGTTSTSFQNAIALRVNVLRAFAGIPAAITLNSSWSTEDQQAALMTSANDALNHSPPSTWTDYTSAGAQAAGNSNLYLGQFGPDAITGYVQDPGSNNAEAGHRRWVLYPPTEQMGTGDLPASGSYKSANALWVFDSSHPYPSLRDGFVAWPPEGYVPYQLIFPRWSFSLPGADFSSATVTVTRSGSNVATTIVSSTDNGYGDNTLVWTLAGAPDGTADYPATSSDTPYSVNVANVKVGGVAQSYTYSVVVFDPSVVGSDDVLPAFSLPASVAAGSTTNLSFTTLPEASGYDVWSATLQTATWVEGAESTPYHLTPQTTGTYSAVNSTTAASGSKCFQLCQDEFNNQDLLLNSPFVASSSSAISFAARYGYLTPTQLAEVQVSLDDGVSWTNVFSRAGTSSDSGSFANQSVSLAAYANRIIRIRFLLAYTGGSAYTETGLNDVGWLIDNITPVALQEASNVSETPAAATPYAFTESSQAGSVPLAVRAVLFNNYPLEYGPVSALPVVQSSTVPVITSAPTATGETGVAFNFSVTAANTGSPTIFGATGLPAGLFISSGSGVISGAATQTGVFDVTLTTTNSVTDETATKPLTITITPGPDKPPTATTGAASLITATGATLSAASDPEASDTTAYFQYGTTSAYGSTSGSADIGSGATSVATSETVTVAGLTAATVYHYRAVASNPNGTTFGADKTFAAPAEPSITTAASAALSATGAEVSLAVNPDGLATTVYLMYGTTTNYGNTTASISLRAGKIATPAFLLFPDLSANTIYYYEVVMVNAAGTFYGPPQQFTTLGFDTTLVAARGTGASGTATTFASFGPPAVNASDGAAFNALLSLGSGVTSANDDGIWADDSGGNLDLLAQTGTSAPGTSAVFQMLSDPVYSDSFEIAFRGLLKIVSGAATGATSAGIWSNGSGPLALVARQGSLAPVSGGTFATFTALGLTSAGPIFYATLNNGSGVTPANSAGIWEGETAQTLALRLGQNVGGKILTKLMFMPAETFVDGQTRSYNASGDVACAATFSDRTTGLVTYIGGAEGLDSVSGATADAIAGATYATFSNPAINDNAHLAYAATMAGTGLTRINNAGIWSDNSGGVRTLVARTGTANAPGTTADFTAFSDPVINNHEAVAFRGTLQVGSGQATSATSSGIWATAANASALALVAREGTQAPGCPTGATFASFIGLALPDVGGPIILGTLNASATAGVSSSNNTGIWAVDRSGTLQSIVRTGDLLEGKTVTGLSFLPSPVYVTGQDRSFSTATGDLVYVATFSDKSTAIFNVVFP
jgi:hypothetical protein